MPLGKGNTCFPPTQFNAYPLITQEHLAGRQEGYNPLPASPGPCPNTSPFGILKIKRYFFFSFGSVVPKCLRLRGGEKGLCAASGPAHIPERK